MERFELDAEQTDAILELKIYRLARLEILVIRNELAEKRKRARQITRAAQGRRPSRWTLVRDEIEEIQKTYGDATAHARSSSDADEVEYTADDFIVDEDNVVIVSRDGWVKRQKEVKDLGDDAPARRRRGAGGGRRAARARRCVFFTNFGAAYTCRIIDVPASTGYGEPIQRLFKFKDGERIVAALSLDPRVGRRRSRRRRKGTPPPVHALAVTSDGYSLRFGLEPLRRAEHARRAALRAARGRRRSGRRRRSPAARR